MNRKLNMHMVMLDPSILNPPYLFGDIVQKGTPDNGQEVYYIICTQADISHPHYLEATASSPSNGEQKILLRHSFVVAIIKLVNLQNRPGFL